MKRDDRLRDLSDDHHAALVLARRARNAGATAHAATCEEVWDAVARGHVRFEERELFPVAQERLADEVLDAVALACAALRE